MEFLGYSVSVPPPPPPLTAEKLGIERSYDGGKLSESEVAAEDRAAMEVSAAATAEESGRERLKRHRREVAGRVWIPELWGQEEFLKDWIDCSAFDASLFPTGIGSARAALVEEGRRANNGGFRLENRSLARIEAEMSTFVRPMKIGVEKFDERMSVGLWQVQVRDVLIQFRLYKDLKRRLRCGAFKIKRLSGDDDPVESNDGSNRGSKK